MRRVFATPHNTPRPQPEMPASLTITRPSGAAYDRPLTSPDVGPTLDGIDEALAQNQLGSLAAETEPFTASVAQVAPENVKLAAEAFPEQWDEARLRNAQVLGRAAMYLTGKAETPEAEVKKSLSNLFKSSFYGDKVAERTVAADGTSSVMEMICKSGARMTAKAKYVDGRIVQYGRTTEERQYNTRITFAHRFPGVDEMSNAEGQNAFAIEQAIASGKFKKGDLMVECSLVPDADHAALQGTGLFLRDVIAIIRTTRLGENNDIIIESHLVCGTDLSKLPPMHTVTTKEAEADVERQALKNRFDIEAFRELLTQLGVKGAEHMSPTEILANPLIVKADEKGEPAMDGVDITMVYDKIVSDKLGAPVMMGSAELYKKAVGNAPRPLTRADYERHFAKMDQLQKDLQPSGEYVARQCAKRWREVSGDDFAAGRLMHELSEQAVVQYFAELLVKEVEHPDSYDTIDRPDMTVMGVETYHHLMAFRTHIAEGNLAMAQRSLYKAEESAQGTGCPLGQRQSKDKSGLDLGFDPMGGIDKPEDDDGHGDRIFRCTEGHINIRNRGELLKKCQTTGCKEGSVGCGDSKPSKRPIGASDNKEMAKKVLQPFAIDGLAGAIKRSKEKGEDKVPAMAGAR